MIIFNNAGHCFLSNIIYEDPIVWVDAQDISTYTLSGNDVLTLDNKGALGGVMTLNGSVKFANGGFESWVVGDFITRDLGEPFLPTNSFTIVATYNSSVIDVGQDIKMIINLYAGDSNELFLFDFNSDTRLQTRSDNNNTKSIFLPKTTNLNTVVISYDLISNVNTINFNGNIYTLTNSDNFTNIESLIINLLSRSNGTDVFGQNNPLHEFRLYNRVMSLVEMQDLQTELNEKYLILGSELVVNGDFSTDSDWTKGSSWTISGGTANSDGTENNGLLRQGILPSGDDKIFRVEFEVLNYVSGEIYPLIRDENGNVSGFSTSNGIFSFDGYRFTSGSDLFYMRGVDFIGSIDNVSVKEILN